MEMDLNDVQGAMRELLGRLNRPAPDFTFKTRPQHDGSPHVEGDGPEFDWIQTERGVELSRRRLTGPELLFVAMESLTAELAQQAELRARGDGVYSRWRWMDAHIRLMKHLEPGMGRAGVAPL